MSYKLKTDEISVINQSLVHSMRDSCASNICLKCAREKNDMITLKSFEDDEWNMADTGACFHCGQVNDVFCSKIIAIKNEHGIDAFAWHQHFPRIMGGSFAIDCLREKVGKLQNSSKGT